MRRLDKLPPYLFSAIDAAKREARERGVEVVDLGVGDPDRPTPPELIEIHAKAAADPVNHRYPAQRGDAGLKQVVAAWMERRHGVRVDPANQVLVLIGSKEGLGHLPLTCVNEGDNALVPDLGYPVYGQATILAGGEPRAFALRAKRDFLPDLQEVARMADERTRMMFLNYPNNPTGAVADETFWNQALAVCRERDIVLVNDAAYLEVVRPGTRGVSMLGCADLESDRVIELHSLSKMFNMTGWRIAFSVGNAEVINDLARVKESIDSGVFTAVQETAAYAMGDAFEELLAGVTAPYEERRRVITGALAERGMEVFPSPATFYVWTKVPGGESSVDFCARALREIGTVVTPGVGFGPGGEGWFRISLTAADADIAEGARRLREWK